MADNAQKTPLGLALNRFTQQKVLDAIATLGQALPCEVVSVAGQIVTVAFQISSATFTLPQVAMPIATSIYDWIPVQRGTLGLTIPASVYLGGVSGLGGGTADLSKPANLSALLFLPVSNSAWVPPTGDQNLRVVQGPDGVAIQDINGTTLLTVTPSGGVFARGTGGPVLGGNLVQAANDVQAAAAGVPINGFYRNNNGVMIRIS